LFITANRIIRENVEIGIVSNLVVHYGKSSVKTVEIGIDSQP